MPIEARDAPAAAAARRADRPSADVVSPTLGILGPERVTITDYKSSDVRDPAKARQRARDSLQLQIYAMGYEAMTGRLPDAVALHFLESGLVGEVEVDPKRLAKARERIADRRGRDAGPRLHARSRTTWPAPTARSATSARRASRAERRAVRGPAGPSNRAFTPTRRRPTRGASFAPRRIRPDPVDWEIASPMPSLARLIRPWATIDGAEGLDSMVMEARDRTANLGHLRRRGGRLGPRRAGRDDPRPGGRPERRVRRRGAHRAGRRADAHPAHLADVFGRHRQIAYRGDWLRAVRRAAWVGIVVAVLVVLRLQGLLELPIALFMIALVVVAEATLSAER